MELTKIVIKNYKSIIEPVTICFDEELPTILIGKNGSGKTNILKALSAIAKVNSHDMSYRENNNLDYRVYIQLSEEDLASILPDVTYDEHECEIVAYSSNQNKEIDCIKSEYIVSSLKNEITDIRDLAEELKSAIADYEKQLIKISHHSDEEIPICCYSLKNGNGGLTNYNHIQRLTEYFIGEVTKYCDNILQNLKEDELVFDFTSDLTFEYDIRYCFKLEFVEPSLAKFEEKFITINTTAIKREISRINRVTQESCEHINDLINELKERKNRIEKGLYRENKFFRSIEKYDWFLCQIQHIIAQKSLFLKNENNDILFQKQDYGYYNNSYENSIVKTYLRQVYDGKDKEQLLQGNSKFRFSKQDLTDFEDYLNDNIPAFEKDMYSSISVEQNGENQISIFLNENNGEKVNFNETSAGRRWYFTYYFMKNTLNKGDMFIIDEPAAMLHPVAQKEVLTDLKKLAKQGIKVVYSTHSPYLITEEWEKIHFVMMTDEGTQVKAYPSNEKISDYMKNIVGSDIFDIQDILDKYQKADKQAVARNCYNAVKNKTKDLNAAAKQMNLSEETIKSWNRNGNHFRTPKLENIIEVSSYAEVTITELLE